jgi:hypothetical protein
MQMERGEKRGEGERGELLLFVSLPFSWREREEGTNEGKSYPTHRQSDSSRMERGGVNSTLWPK